jgi:hypothetical protein
MAERLLLLRRLQKEASEVFFAVTKLFQNKDSHLRRMVYLCIKDICPGSDEVIIVTSSLMKVMGGARRGCTCTGRRVAARRMQGAGCRAQDAGRSSAAGVCQGASLTRRRRLLPGGPQDMNSKVDLYRSNAIRVLCSIIDSQLLAQIERYLKQAVVDKSPVVASAVLVSALHLQGNNMEVRRRTARPPLP